MEGDQLVNNEVKVLVQLLLGSGLVTREEFARASEVSENEKIPLLTAVASTGFLTDASVQLSVQAQKKVLANEISSDLAIRALRVALQRRLTLQDAIASVQKLHQQTQVAVSATNELTTILLTAKFITNEDLGRFIKLSADSGMMIGHLLLLDNKMTTDELLGALNAVVMGRDNRLNKNNAAQGLRYARQRQISFEQALFELDFMKNPEARGIRMGELFSLAGLITKEDLAECYEIELFKSKSFGQILLERGLVTSQQVQCATILMNMVGDDKLKAYQAAEALFTVVKQGRDLDSVVEQYKGRVVDDTISLTDLLVEAGAVSLDVLERTIPRTATSWGEQGAALLKAQILNEQAVITTLRLKALVGLGYLTRDKAVAILTHCVRERTPLELALTNLSIMVPARVQWTWVQGVALREF